jgi:hypothetical protein
MTLEFIPQNLIIYIIVSTAIIIAIGLYAFQDKVWYWKHYFRFRRSGFTVNEAKELAGSATRKMGYLV